MGLVCVRWEEGIRETMTRWWQNAGPVRLADDHFNSALPRAIIDI